MATQIKIVIDGNTISGWESISVSRALGSLSGDFTFNLTDFPLADTKTINPGKAIVIEMVGDTSLSHKLMTGYIDRVSRSKDANSTTLEFNGRDKTSDLIDSAALYKTSNWRKKKISQICKDICNPFGIPVVLETSDFQVEDFALQSGETAFTAIERLARAYSIMLITDEFGRLKLSRVSANRAEVRLVVGQNVKSVLYEEDYSGRYSKYYARGQGKGSGNEWSNDIVALKGESEDLGVDRYRPYVFSVEKKMNRTEIQKRVNWEAQVRAGRAVRCDVVVKGWLQDPTSFVSAPWAVNTIVNIVDEKWGIDSEFIISAVTFTLSNTEGRTTALELSPPEIFAADPSEKIELSRRSSVRPT